jgi:tRNA(Arg) A34 adenosine deaminase TadA
MDKEFIQKAIELSKQSVMNGGYPIGALIVQNNKVIGTGISNGKQLCDATSHAETATMERLGGISICRCT